MGFVPCQPSCGFSWVEPGLDLFAMPDTSERLRGKVDVLKMPVKGQVCGTVVISPPKPPTCPVKVPGLSPTSFIPDQFPVRTDFGGSSR